MLYVMDLSLIREGIFTLKPDELRNVISKLNFMLNVSFKKYNEISLYFYENFIFTGLLPPRT